MLLHSFKAFLCLFIAFLMACKELKREILDSGNSFLHNSDYVFLKKIVNNQSINKSPKIAYR